MIRRNLIGTVLLVCLLAFLSACGSRQRVVLPADFKGPKELSRLYGVRLTPNDNIYLYNEGAKWLGVPYRSGGLTRRGVDCSGLTTQIYKKVYRKKLKNNADDQRTQDCRKVTKGKLEEGDLVFFHNGRSKRRATHVGIYLKDGKFIHASSSQGVIISRVNDTYYRKCWMQGGRVK